MNVIGGVRQIARLKSLSYIGSYKLITNKKGLEMLSKLISMIYCQSLRAKFCIL